MSRAPSSWRRALAAAVACVVIAAVTWLAYRPVLALPLLGWDSYPLIAATGVEQPATLAHLLGQELMDGRYPDGRFYRPVTTLSFALDRARHGLSPRGYHTTDLGLLMAAGALLFATTRRLFGREAGLAGLAAGLVFVLHPIQLEVLPYPPRRADMLCLVFLLAALAAQPAPARGFGRGRAVAAFGLGLLAAGSKETGVIAALIVWILHCAEATGGVRERLLRASHRTVPTLLGAAVYLAVRTGVLGGLGGHRESSLTSVLSAHTRILPYLERVLWPQPLGPFAPGQLPLVLILAALIGVGAALAVRRAAPEPDPRSSRTGWATLAGWTAALLAISSVAGRMHDWYAMLFAAPYAVALGHLLFAGWSALQRRRWLAAAVLLCASLPLALTHLATSRLLRPYTNLEDAGRLAEESLGRLDRALARAQLGDVLRVNPWVPMLPPHSDGSGAKGLFLFSDYSLQAYCELVAPAKHPLVSIWGRGDPSPDPTGVKVLLVPGRPPSWIERH